MLQRSAPATTDRDSDESPTPSPKSPTNTITRTEVTSNIDPALSGVSSPGSVSESGDSARDRAEEAWIENIRVIEALRKLISDKLERKEYEDDEDTEMGGTSDVKEEKSSSADVAYPTLRADDD
jgi:hypothetical protein